MHNSFVRLLSLQPAGKTPRLVASCSLGIALLLGACGTVLADGNPDIVGVLSAITDPQIAADLGLSEEQLDRLKALIKGHEAKAIEFAAELRSLDAGERRERAKQKLRSIEAEGMGLLNDSQRARAEQIRLRGLGVAAVLEPEIATATTVSPEQLAKIQTLVEGRRGMLRELGPEKGEAEYKRQLEAVLDDAQKAKWAELIGPDPKASTTADAANGADANAAEVQASPSDQPVAGSMPSGVATSPEMGQVIPGEFGLRLNFNSVPWSDVLKWLAKEAELSLQTDFFPPGTFTYRDPFRVYTVPEAMDIMNSVLLSRGYTLVRRQRALMCVDLGTGENAEVIRGLIRELADLVPEEQLDSRGEYEICKSVFELQRLSVEDAEKEVKQLLGPQGSLVPLGAANQLLVTETAGKLRIIRDTLRRSETPDAGRTSKIVAFTLENMSADELLSIARPLLGLKDTANVSEELSVSTDAFGTKLYATGTPDKLQKLRDIVTQVDVASSDSGKPAATAEQLTVKSHMIRGSDPQTTMDVLQTQFSGQTNINLALDPKSSNVIARATASDHQLIDEIISTLSGETSDFEVIELDKIDTQAAILTLEKFFGKQSTKDKEAGTAKGPIFYGDTLTRRVYVKGTPQEVGQVRSLLNKVQDSGPTLDGLRNNTRFLPYSGKSADKVLDQIDLLWEATKHRGRIRKIEPKEPGAKASTNNERQRPANDDPNSSAMRPVDIDPNNQATLLGNAFAGSNTVRFARAEKPVIAEEQPPAEESETKPADESSKDGVEKELKIFRGPTGLIVTSDDPMLLKEFDEIAGVVQEQMAAGPSEPTVIYLKYIPALAADELIRGVLAGGAGTASSGGGGGGLLGEVASSVLGGGGFLGSLLGMGGGGSSAASSASSSSSGDVFITADPRLNALWVQANPLDMQLIEQLVEIIDTAESPVDVQTRGVPNIIYLQSAPVAEVEATVKSVFADRIAGGANNQNAQRPPSPQEFIEALRGGGGGGGGGRRQNAPKELKEQTMTVTADKKNNALIVLASKQLFQEVEELVKLLDQQAEGTEDTVQVLPIGGDINPTTVQSALSRVFGAQARTSSSGSGTTPAPQNNAASPQASAFQGFRGFNPGGMGGGGFGGFQGMGGMGGGQGGRGQGGFGGGQGGFGGFQGMGGRGQGGGGFGGGGFGGGGFGGGQTGGGGGNRGGNRVNRGGN
jgi:type II secretory pathway component GspD/PulD (secretin)